MKTVAKVPYSKTPYTSKIIKDFLSRDIKLTDFYNRDYDTANIEEQISQKRLNYSSQNRKVLCNALRKQYKDIPLTQKSSKHLEYLKKENAFTITTGHQLNLFTGPLYALYKVIDTLKTADLLSQKYTDYHFVPIFWMASEDHDFQEINHFRTQDSYNEITTIKWDIEDFKNNQAVGGMSFLDKAYGKIYRELSVVLKNTYRESSEFLLDLFEKSYKGNDLSKATRILLNTLFGDYGLLCLDGNHASLKELFKPFMRNDLQHHHANDTVSKTSSHLKDIAYKAQAYPRDVNLFYINNDNTRSRISWDEAYQKYHLVGTDIYKEASLLFEELEQHPSRFSPNVILRPLYQEVVLPNLAYIGGGGELSYWLQLKDFFDSQSVVFPMLKHRCAALLVSDKWHDKSQDLSLSYEDLFQHRKDFLDQQLESRSKSLVDFTSEKSRLEGFFNQIYEIALQTDKSFITAVKASQEKQHQQLIVLEKKLLKAERKKHQITLQRLERIYDILFPDQKLQERYLNFISFYALYKKDFIQALYKNIDTEFEGFTVIVY